ncbi:MAG TPA: hypothetical protein VD971_13145 [Phycisphaerales bacterium]|nr:hypothetical protein [Phycisphaerales bacterium]
MGIHIGLIAAKVPVAQLREIVLQTWSEYKVTASENLPSEEALWAWREKHEVFVSAADWSPTKRGTTVFAFWQDGPWAVMMDWTYTLATDEQKLAGLSNRLGTVLTLVIETVSASVTFACYEAGVLRRMIDSSDGKVSFRGEALVEEAGIDIDRFYVEESRALWTALGLGPIDSIPSNGLQAVCTVDQTDYSSSASDHGMGATTATDKHAAPAARQWWKFW